jgi:hypothetical protein
MTGVKEIVGAVAFEDGVQLSFRISRMELEKNDDTQLGSLVRSRIDQAIADRNEYLAFSRKGITR